MGESFLYSGFYLLADSLILGLLLYLVCGGLWRRLRGVSVYLFALLLIDGLGRRYILYYYGARSLEYYYFYWLTDVVLALGAFLLVCTFFQRACSAEGEKWRFLRHFLEFVFILVVGVSAFSLSRNYNNLFGRFIIEFEQNLFFTCLVLNTLLYIMMQQMDSADEELGLLVCGMGLQFAGPAANMALVFLTPGHQYASELMTFVSPLCTLGMLLTWFYAVARKPKTARIPAKKLVPAIVAGRQVA